MANLNVMRTDGTSEEMLKKDEKNMIQLFLMPLSNLEAKNSHEIGDFMENTKFENRFSIIVRDQMESKAIIGAFRFGLISLFNKIAESEINTILVDSYSFLNSKEEHEFVCAAKEILFTYYSELIQKDMYLIITNYRRK